MLSVLAAAAGVVETRRIDCTGSVSLKVNHAQLGRLSLEGEGCAL